MALQIQNLFCAIISALFRDTRSGKGELRDFLNKHLEGEKRPLLISSSSDRSINTAALIRDVTILVHDTQAYVKAFVNTWFEKVLKIQRSHRLDKHASYEFTDPPTSFVERRRIWQAILRLFSYADFFQHNPGGCTNLNDFENGPHVFFSNVAIWELEELEYVYYLSK